MKAQRALLSLAVKNSSILKKAAEIVNQGAPNGSFRVGKEFCDAFLVSHPKIRTAAEYHKILMDQSPKFIAELQKEEQQNAVEQDKQPMWESKYSCFDRNSEKLIKRNGELMERFKKYLILDFETTTKAMHKRKASPFTPENRVVYTAWRKHAGAKGPAGSHVDGPFPERDSYKDKFPSLKDVDVIVGHNIKFDLLYIWDNLELKEFFRRGGLVWDTMYAEYLICGHKDTGGLSLDSVSLNYGGEQKDSYIKEQWQAGVDTPDIDPKRIIEYARADVDNTHLVFKKQLERLSDGLRLPVVNIHMEGLLATTEMEYNGLFVCNERVKEMIAVNAKEVAEAEKDLLSSFTPAEIVQVNEKIKELSEDAPPIEFNWASSTQLQSYLFGGTCVYKTRMTEPGAKKPKLTSWSIDFKGIVPDEWKQTNENRFLTPTGNWKVSDDVITSISDTYKSEAWADSISKLRAIKKGKKIASTYLTALEGLVDHNGILHPQLNHVITRTGRLSSANPNMQNIPRDKNGVKRCLETRFKDKNGEYSGVMIESDYSQLEVFVMALLSQDSVLMQELDSGSDLHCKRLARMKGKDYEEVVKLCKVDKDPYWTDQRTKAKVFSFQRQYGAGNKTISLTTGLSLDEVAALVEAEKKAYPFVEAYFDRVAKALKDTSSITGTDEGFYDSPSGSRWYFEAVPVTNVKAKRGDKEFRRQLILNHPVQGFAAEIVFTCLGRLWRHFVSNGNYSESGDFTKPGRAFMVNTVHDCVWVDTRKEVERLVTEDIEKMLGDVKEAYAPHGFKIKNWVPFRTETTSGVTMADL